MWHWPEIPGNDTAYSLKSFSKNIISPLLYFSWPFILWTLNKAFEETKFDFDNSLNWVSGSSLSIIWQIKNNKERKAFASACFTDNTFKLLSNYSVKLKKYVLNALEPS